MAQRVLSTDAARSAIQQLQGIIGGDFEGTLRRLDTQGRILSDPSVWDGPLAVQFRDMWPRIHTSLNQTMQQLTELRARIQTINQDIMSAGGGA